MQGNFWGCPRESASAVEEQSAESERTLQVQATTRSAREKWGARICCKRYLTIPCIVRVYWQRDTRNLPAAGNGCEGLGSAGGSAAGAEKHGEFGRSTSVGSGRRIIFLITTNGTASTEDMAWMMENDFNISVSCDGPPDIQNRNRPFVDGRPSRAVVEETLKLMVAHQYPFTVRLSFSEADDIVRILEHLAALGVANLRSRLNYKDKKITLIAE